MDLQACTMRAFQFTLPCRERRMTSQIADFIFEFQFTLPCRERQAPKGEPGGRGQFQFTLPCRERLSWIEKVGPGAGFNSRSRVGSDTKRADDHFADAEFQFTLPCRERPPLSKEQDDFLRVSIHAPV